MDKKITLEEIREAQAEIAAEMADEGQNKKARVGLEKASIHLRNLESLLVATVEKQLIVSLKSETLALHALTEEMDRTSRKLATITGILRKIVRRTGQIIDILEMVK